MTRRGNRMAQKGKGHQTKSSEELHDVVISGNKNNGGKIDGQNSPSLIEPLVKQSRKKSISNVGKKILKKQESLEDDVDDEISFNFKARNMQESEASAKTESVQLKNTGRIEKQDKTSKSPTANQEEHNQSHQASDKVSMAGSTNQELDEVTMDTTQVQKKRVSKKQPKASSPEGKKQSGVQQKSRKRKASCQVNDVPVKKAPKSEDIFFYCGNLPPGVTRETLRFFLEEEGIHPRIFIKHKKGKQNPALATLTPKQKLYKKNQLQEAKSLFATVIVKTEEEAQKMMSLNGIEMPSPSNKEWDTELKIIRRLPRPKKFPYKVHVGGLHPEINEEELRQYLLSRYLSPGHVVIIRTPRTQKSRRYGFVWFESVRDAGEAVDLAEPLMRERPLVIQHSFKKKFKNF